MIYLNYSHLDQETQTHLLSTSKREVENKYGLELKVYAIEQGLEYSEVLEEEATRNLYNFQYVFNI